MLDQRLVDVRLDTLPWNQLWSSVGCRFVCKQCGTAGSTRHENRNVPSPDMLRLMERSSFEVALRVLTAIAVLALLSYLLFGPSI